MLCAQGKPNTIFLNAKMFRMGLVFGSGAPALCYETSACALTSDLNNGSRPLSKPDMTDRGSRPALADYPPCGYPTRIQYHYNRLKTARTVEVYQGLYLRLRQHLPVNELVPVIVLGDPHQDFIADIAVFIVIPRRIKA